MHIKTHLSHLLYWHGKKREQALILNATITPPHCK